MTVSIVALLLFGLCICEARLTFVSGYDPNITSWNLDDSGKLTYITSTLGVVNASWMAWNSNRRFMYTVNEIGNPQGGGVTALAIDYPNSQLKVINAVPSGGGLPCFARVHISDRWLFVANYEDGFISIFPINQKTGAVGVHTYNQKNGEWAHMMITDRTGRFVFVPFKGSDYIAQYLFDERTGALTPNPAGEFAKVQPGSGPRHLVFHPSERWAYAVTELASTVITFTFDPMTGILQPVDTISTLPPNFNGTSYGGEILITPFGRYVYASNRGHDSIAIFEVAEATGKLSIVGWETGGGTLITPRGVAFDDTFAHLLVAAQGGNTVTSFTISHEKGTLTKVMQVPVTNQPSFIGDVGH